MQVATLGADASVPPPRQSTSASQTTTLSIKKSASLPELPYHNKPFITHKTYTEVIPEDAMSTVGHVPGYTGHQHAAKHIYGNSYGTTTKKIADIKEDMYVLGSGFGALALATCAWESSAPSRGALFTLATC